jgi:MCM AAA-lid domain
MTAAMCSEMNRQRTMVDKTAQAVPITVRQLEALVRISESLAKMRLSADVTVLLFGVTRFSVSYIAVFIIVPYKLLVLCDIQCKDHFLLQYANGIDDPAMTASAQVVAIVCNCTAAIVR